MHAQERFRQLMDGDGDGNPNHGSITGGSDLDSALNSLMGSQKP